MRIPGARASCLFYRPVLRAALGGDAISLTGQMREMTFIHSFLGFFTHSPHLGQICTKPQDTMANGGTVLGVLTSLSPLKRFAQRPGELRRGARGHTARSARAGPACPPEPFCS